ncbi:MAG: VCBS repeat-containing protein [Acidobacteria bacterium]|nr:VCBS repeat-containing protein [Acidobacteriota bacterium]
MRWMYLIWFSWAGLSGETFLLGPGSNVRIVNGQPFDQTVLVRSLDQSGATVAQTSYSVPSGSVAQITLEAPPVALQIIAQGEVAAASIVNHQGMLDVRQNQAAHNLPLLIPHIAENLSFWDTHTEILSAAGLSDVVIKSPQRITVTDISSNLQSVSIDLESLFSETPTPGSGWGVMRARDAELVSLLAFQTADGKTGTSLPLPLQRSNLLILPHVPSDRATWWSGLALVNSNQTSANVRATVYAQGQVVTTRSLQIQPQSKQVGLIDDLLTPAIPLQSDWILFESNVPLAGFELFGTRNGETLTGLALGYKFHKHVAFSHTAPSGWWSGLALLNPGPAAIQIRVRANRDSGPMIDQTVIDLGPNEKKTILPEQVFGLSRGDAWLELESDYGFISFQLYGDQAQELLATFTPSSLRAQTIDLATPVPSVDMAENLSAATSDVKDLDGDGDDELAILTNETLSVVDWQPGPTLTSSPHTDFDYVNETSVPPNLFLEDLDGDGLSEVMVLTREMTLATLDAEHHPTRLQPARPEVADDPVIRDFADVNNDGMLDILTHRRLFKSQLGLTNFYFWNTFPYMFANTGRGSLFLDLNQDPNIDILTVLFDSVFAVLTNKLDVDPDPIYTPQQFQDIIAIYRGDFNGDQKEDIMSLLAETHESATATAMDISTYREDGADTIAQFPLLIEWGLNELVPVNRNNRQLFGQEIDNFTRYWDVDLDQGLQVAESRAWRGHDADVNGDGLLDLVAPSGVLLGEPNNHWDQPALPILLRRTTSDVITAFQDDYDDDAQMEVLTMRRTGSSSFLSVDLWEYQTDGRSWEPQHLLEANVVGTSLIDLSDMDGDGDLDLVFIGFGIRYFPWEESGFSANPIFLHTPDRVAVGPARFSEINGNHTKDLIAENPDGSNRVRIIYDVYGENPVTEDLSIYVPLAQLELVDADRDGDLDIKVDSPSRGRFILQRAGEQWQRRDFNFNMDHYELVDFSGDGILDTLAYVTSPDKNTQYLRFLKHRGDFTYYTAFTLELPPQTHYTALAAMDVNGDGRQDILALGTTETATSQYLDIWESRYTDPLEEIPFARLQRLEWRHAAGSFDLVDFDYDGFQDLQFWVDYHFLWYRARTSYFPYYGVNPYPWPTSN